MTDVLLRQVLSSLLHVNDVICVPSLTFTVKSINQRQRAIDVGETL